MSTPTRTKNATEFYLFIDDQQKGPFAMGQIRGMWNAGTVTTQTLCWHEGLDDWKPLKEFQDQIEGKKPQAEPPVSHLDVQRPALNAVQRADAIARQMQTAQSARPIATSEKSRGVYIILGLLLGCLGIHNFYAGRNKAGAIQLILFVLLFWTILVPGILAIWAIIEICTVTTDGAGEQMKL